jgi:hypothetical protein
MICIMLFPFEFLPYIMLLGSALSLRCLTGVLLLNNPPQYSVTPHSVTLCNLQLIHVLADPFLAEHMLLQIDEATLAVPARNKDPDSSFDQILNPPNGFPQ